MIIKCESCGRMLYVKEATDKLPQHKKPNLLPCENSGMPGKKMEEGIYVTSVSPVVLERFSPSQPSEGVKKTG